MFKEYLPFIANRRCQKIGLDTPYAGATNPFPWMSEMMNLKKEKNFFGTRVTEYQTGGALSSGIKSGAAIFNIIQNCLMAFLDDANRLNTARLQ